MPEFRSLLALGGEMGERIRLFDWTSNPLGPPSGWPQSLRSALSICLTSSMPTSIYWGREFRLLYNDAWRFIPGPRHPSALGAAGAEVWSDIWEIVGPQLEQVVTSGRGFVTRDQMLPMTRFGEPEETYWDYSFTPIAGEDGRVVGVLNQGLETTERVGHARRTALLLALNESLRPLDNASEMIAIATRLLGEHLGVGRVGYGEVDPAHEKLQLERAWTDGTMTDIAGTYTLDNFGKALHDRLCAGVAYAVDDRDRDPRLTEVDRRRYAAIGAGAVLVSPVVRHGRYIGLMFAHDTHPRRWTAEQQAATAAVAETLYQEIARMRAETALRDSEGRYRLIFEQAHDIVFTADLEQRITAANPAAAAALATTSEQLIGRSIAEFISSEDFERTSTMLREKLRAGGTTRYEVKVISPSGLLDWEINSTLAINRDGQATGLHAIARDITERRAFEDRQQLLINELNHRVKNTLALVQGLALQSFRGDRDRTESQAAFQARLATLAAAHDLLTRERWEGATLGQLVRDATRAHVEEGERLVIDGPEVLLNPRAAISLVLALHELGTNAAKYGALSVPSGQVSIDWAVVDGRLRIDWRETGGPRVSAPERRGFGLRMIERALGTDLNGTVSVAFDPGGLHCTIDAPAPADARIAA
ncbi:HWE histidine kinase domain-containing protein [Sphingomonas sp. 1P06PA]|uniref:PAS domain-containing sensor histidine kinase n=1 Tax=Sphingomonas sp. 1P06PA TaxID=554121 RepID=UPI0039A58B87